MTQEHSAETALSSRANETAFALRQLRKWGYRIVRDPLPGDKDEQELDAGRLGQSLQTIRAACALLGLPAKHPNTQSYDVRTVAMALAQNAVDTQSGVERYPFWLERDITSDPAALAATFNEMTIKKVPGGVDFLARILPQAVGVELDENQTTVLRGLIAALPAGATFASLLRSMEEHDAGRIGIDIAAFALQQKTLAPLFEALLLNQSQK